MKITEQQITTIDNNETKARAILQSLAYALEMDADTGEQINVLDWWKQHLTICRRITKFFPLGCKACFPLLVFRLAKVSF